MKKTLTACLLFASLNVPADIKMVASDSSGQTMMFVNENSVRIDIGGKRQSVLYSADQAAFQHVNHDEKSYMTFDQEMIQELGATMNAAMSQMEAAMAGLPKEQQELMARMMGKSMPSEAPPEPKIDVRKTGGKKDVQGYPCEKYIVLEDGELTTELWVASYPSLGISKQDIGAFMELTKFQEEMVKSFKNNPLAAKSLKSGIKMFDQVDGFPMLVTQYEDGDVVNEFRIESVDKVEGDEERFDVPSTYREQSMPGMSGGDGGGVGSLFNR